MFSNPWKAITLWEENMGYEHEFCSGRKHVCPSICVLMSSYTKQILLAKVKLQSRNIVELILIRREQHFHIKEKIG